jgi:putative transposase
VRSVKQECLAKLSFFGEGALRRGLNEYLAHYRGERNHQGKGNLLLFSSNDQWGGNGSTVRCRQLLGGLLNYYARAA